MILKTINPNSLLYLPGPVLHLHIVNQRHDRWGIASVRDCLERVPWLAVVPWSMMAPFGAAMISAIMVGLPTELDAVAVALFYFCGCG